jgi:hypothetical protein
MLLKDWIVLSQISDCFAGFFLRLVFDCASWTYFIAACAEHDAVVWVFHHRSFLAVFIFKFESSKRTVFHAFSAPDAFLIVYCGVPGYFASGNSMPSFFRHFLNLVLEVVFVVLACTYFRFLKS